MIWNVGPTVEVVELLFAVPVISTDSVLSASSGSGVYLLVVAPGISALHDGLQRSHW